MRKSFLLIIALAPLAVVTGSALTIAANPATSGQSAAAPALDVLDLNAIPIKPVTGPQAVRGVGDEDDGDDVLANKGGNGECTATGGEEGSSCDDGGDDD